MAELKAYLNDDYHEIHAATRFRQDAHRTALRLRLKNLAKFAKTLGKGQFITLEEP